MQRPPTRPDHPARGDGTWAALGVAALLHAALLALTPLFPAPWKAPPALSDTVRGDTFDIETVPAPGSPGEPREEGAQAGSAASPHRQAEDKAPPPGALRAKTAFIPRSEPIERGRQEPEPSAPRGDESPSEAPGARGPSEGPSTPPGGAPPGGASPGDTFSPLEGPAPILGLGGSPAWAIPGVLGPPPPPVAAPTVAPAARPVDSNIAGQVLSGSLHKKDQTLGLDLPAGGVVASTIANAVRSSAAPLDARATFEVRLDGDGKVLGVRVVSSSAGDAGTWERIAKSAGAALGAKSLAMSGDAASKGATVTVKVESKVVYPAGSKEKIDVQPVCANEVIEDLINGISTPNAGEPGRGPNTDPAANRPDPSKENAGPDAEERRRVFCIPIGVRGKGDLSNLGAHTQTVVRSSFKVVVPGLKQLEDVKEVDQRAPWSKPDPNKVQKIRPKWPKKKKKKQP